MPELSYCTNVHPLASLGDWMQSIGYFGPKIKEMGGKIIATKLEVVPADKKGHKTIMQYKKIQFNLPIKDDFFTIQNMKRVK